MKQILKSLFLALLFYQSNLFCDQNNFEDSLKNTNAISHKFDQQLRHLKKIKFFVQKYAINGQLKSALLSRIKELEQKLSWFNDFSLAIPFITPLEDKTKIKFNVKNALFKQLATSIDQEIKAIELAASNLLKLSLDGLCPNLNYQEQLDQSYKNNIEKPLEKNNSAILSASNLLRNVGSAAGGTAIAKTTEKACDKFVKFLTPESCWATRAECKKHWFYLSLDIMPTTNKFRSESAYWYNLLYKLEQLKLDRLNPEDRTLEKQKLIDHQKALLQEQSELKAKFALSGNIKLLEKEIEASKIPVNTHTEEQLIAALKRLIDLRLNQIHALNNRKSVGKEAEKEISDLTVKIAELKLVAKTNHANL